MGSKRTHVAVKQGEAQHDLEELFGDVVHRLVGLSYEAAQEEVQDELWAEGDPALLVDAEILGVLGVDSDKFHMVAFQESRRLQLRDHSRVDLSVVDEDQIFSRFRFRDLRKNFLVKS